MSEFSGEIVVLYGGVGAEREVSIRTGTALLNSLETNHRVRGIELSEAALPGEIDPDKAVVFPALHGEFGEDGVLQGLLDAKGFEYCGSDAESSALCMDKARTKERAIEAGIQCPESLILEAGSEPDLEEVAERLGERIVMKPVDGGSSHLLYILDHASELKAALEGQGARRWLLESFVDGREVSIGVLNGQGMGIVEIVPEGGVYDYEHKYTNGKTEYRWPAVLEEMAEATIRHAAETAFAVCGCRDFARVDFRIGPQGPCLLEINTIPGLTSESLLPKSADCRGLSFDDLAEELVLPAINRFQRRAK